jgi:hypothetical protein
MNLLSILDGAPEIMDEENSERESWRFGGKKKAEAIKLGWTNLEFIFAFVKPQMYSWDWEKELASSSTVP